MNEQQIITEIINSSEVFIRETFFGIIEESLTDHPLHQAIGKLEINGQIRIMCAINDYF